MIKINIKSKINNTLNSLRRRNFYNTNNNSNKSFYRKQLNRILICILIVLVVLIIKKINVKFTNNIIRIVDNSINYSIDVKKDTRKFIDFVKNVVKIPDKVVETFSPEVWE